MLIVNEYTHAGYGAEEYYYFTFDGEMVCCVSTLYGESFNKEDYTDYFYYSGVEAIYFMDNSGEATDVIEGETATKAFSRIQASVTMTELFNGRNIRAP